MPTVLPTHHPLWLRVMHALKRWLARRTPALSNPVRQGGASEKNLALRDSDLWHLAGLSDALQADIGLPDALRARRQALLEREALWYRY